jgi:hypothetical protein
MPLNPLNDSPKKTCRDIVSQRRFAATASNLPGRVPSPGRYLQRHKAPAATDPHGAPQATIEAGQYCLAMTEG